MAMVYSLPLEGEWLTRSCPCYWKAALLNTDIKCRSQWKAVPYEQSLPLTQTAICVKVKCLSYKHSGDANMVLLTSLHEGWLWERLQLSCGFFYEPSVSSRCVSSSIFRGDNGWFFWVSLERTTPHQATLCLSPRFWGFGDSQTVGKTWMAIYKYRLTLMLSIFSSPSPPTPSEA